METGTTTVTVTYNSIIGTGGTTCLTYTEQGRAFPLLPNDPAVTGVQNIYSLPIRIGF